MSLLHQLTEEHRAELKAARDQLNTCPECQGKPVVNYEPGCVYTFCAINSPTCPCISAAPDFRIGELTRKINRKIES